MGYFLIIFFLENKISNNLSFSNTNVFEEDKFLKKFFFVKKFFYFKIFYAIFKTFKKILEKFFFQLTTRVIISC